MLYRLEIENFYSIRHPQVVDLRIGDAVPEECGRFDPIFTGSSERASRVAAFFGPNASGKSTVLRGLTFLMWFVQHSFQGLAPATSLEPVPFNCKGAHEAPMRLAIEFGGPLDLNFEKISDDDPHGTYRYELVMQRHGTRTSVVSESLKQRRDGKGKWIKVFERVGSKVSAGKAFELGGYSLVFDKVRDNASFIATLAQFDHKPSKNLQDTAKTIIANIVIDRAEFSDADAINFYSHSAHTVEALNKEIARIDLGIRNMHIHQGHAWFEHEGLEHPMPWSFESHGTRNFIKHFPILNKALLDGGMAVVDELDISIHPLVLPEVIKWFHSDEKNPKSAQLWLTCHAASLLEDLAKEEVFFCEKNSKGETSVYGLQDIKNVRRTDNRYRKYLSGAYGSIPNIG